MDRLVVHQPYIKRLCKNMTCANAELTIRIHRFNNIVNLVPVPVCSSLSFIPAYITESNALRKSTKHAKSLPPFLLQYLSINVIRINIWSEVRRQKWRQIVKSPYWRYARESSYTPHVRRHFLAPVGFTEIPVGYARKYRLTWAGVRQLSCMTSLRLFDVMTSVFDVMTSVFDIIFSQKFGRQRLR